MKYENYHISIVIPYYKAEHEILKVVSAIPDYVNDVIIVNDDSPDNLPVAEIKTILNNKIQHYFIDNKENLGVGGATKIGFEKAISNGADIVIKVDADNQMDLTFIPDLLNPIISGTAEVAKGNRFRDLKTLSKMPFFRRTGNLILSFLIKMATGYWHIFDPTNGFFAIQTKALKRIDFSKISNRYYFETSLLAELYFHKTVIQDVAMPAIYGNEKSNMQVWKMPFVFTPKLISTFCKRIIKTYFLYDFNLGSIYLLSGVPLFLFGVGFGIYTWVEHADKNILTPTGTIMIITLALILGFQLLLQAIQFDIINTPKSK